MMRNMKKVIFAGTFLFSLLASSFFVGPRVQAAVASGCTNSLLGFPTWYAYLDVEKRTTSSGDEVCVVVGPKAEGEERLNVTAVATRVALAVLDILLRLAGMVAFGFIVYSGFKFALSQGDPQKEKDARETAINAIIGMVIAIFAVVLVSFIGRQITK